MFSKFQLVSFIVIFFILFYPWFENVFGGLQSEKKHSPQFQYVNIAQLECHNLFSLFLVKKMEKTKSISSCNSRVPRILRCKNLFMEF